VTGRSSAELLLDPFPKLAANKRFMLPSMSIMLVPDLTQIDWIREQMVDRSTRERLAAANRSLLGDLGPRDDPALFQIDL